jgi:exosortase
VLGHAIEVWRSDPELSFGFVVVPATAFLVALRWRALVAFARRPRNLGLIPIAIGLVGLLAGTRTGIHAIAAVSVLPTVLGVVVYLVGVAPAVKLAVPVVFLTIGLSLYRGLLAPLGFALQQLTAELSAGAASVLGFTVHRSGVDLFTPHVHLVVAESCSGMDSLLALLCLGGLFVSLTRASAARRLLLLTAVVPITLAANVVRVTLVVILSEPLGVGIAEGTSHQLLGASLFLCASILFVLAGLALKCTPTFAATSLSSS